MKFRISKPRLLLTGSRAPYWSVRIYLENTYEEQAAKQLYPKLGKSPKGRHTKAATEIWLHEIQRAIEYRAHLLSMGMPVQDTESIEKRITEYLEWGKVQGGKRGLKWAVGHDVHVQEYLRCWVETLSLKSLSDIRQAPFDREIVKYSKYLAPNTVNHRARALTALCNWAVRQGFLPISPLQFRALDKTPVNERGAFTLEELKILFAGVPWTRSILYRSAYYLRLRRGELASLGITSVLWSDGFIRLDFRDAKDRKTAMIPVPGKLLKDIWETTQGKKDSEKLFDFSPKHAARILHKDMEQLGIPLMMNGRKRDFHSLGASTATSMDRRGIAPALASKTMRHKSWAQTENYIKLETEQVRVVTQGLEDEIEVERTERTEHTERNNMSLESMNTGASASSPISPSPSALTFPTPHKTAKFRKFPKDERKAPIVTYLKFQEIVTHLRHTVLAGGAEDVETFLKLSPSKRSQLMASLKRQAV